jgi:probable rRNA maturation factor
VLEVEVLVRERLGGAALSAQEAPSGAGPLSTGAGLERAARAALAAAAVHDGHLAIVLVDAGEIRRLNRDHRGRDTPTDVLSFPIDEAASLSGPRELGDVVICPEHTEHLVEAVVHGVLHLCGYDHEVDDGEMLALQARVVAGL